MGKLWDKINEHVFKATPDAVGNMNTGTAVSDERVVDQAFICSDGKLITAADVARANDIVLDIQKSIAGSTQKQIEATGFQGTLSAINSTDIPVEPPFNPDILAALLKLDEVHYRCCRTKTIDSVGRQWDILPNPTSMGMFNGEDSTNTNTANLIKKEIATARGFIDECNEFDGFEGVIERACMDYESIGWGAMEVIRSVDMKIRKLVHIPAPRLKVLQGRTGFVELGIDGRLTYYQNFGAKVLSKTRKNLAGKNEEYRPLLDGELSGKNCTWNFVSSKDFKRTSDYRSAANEIMYVPKFHPGSIHYGIPDGVAAIGYIVGNVHIRNYFLQFFEHNAVPQYAVIIEGAKLSKDVEQLIQHFFSQEVKGQAHKTLIIPIPHAGGDVKVRFEKLAADEKEGSFQETKKNNQQSIMTAHGVSAAIIGINETASLGSGKGMSQSDNYKNRIIMPSQGRWSRELTKLLRLGLGITRVRLDFDPLDIRDEKEESTVLIKYMMSGCMTINQVREKAKLGDKVEGGDRAFVVLGSDVLFIDDMTAAPSSLLEKIKETKAALIPRKPNANKPRPRN